MDSIEHHTTIKLPPEPPPRPPRFTRLRAWLRSRKGRVIFPIATFATGMTTALLIVLLVLLSLSKDIASISQPPLSQGDIVIQVGTSYITHIVSQDLRTAGLPGTVKNVRVTFVRGDQMNIDGDDQFSVVGISFTRHFTINLQPYVHNCQLQVHVLHADLSSIPVTSFVASFESQINRQLLVKTTDLPQGFTYCNTGVRTDPSGLFIIYTATPV